MADINDENLDNNVYLPEDPEDEEDEDPIPLNINDLQYFLVQSDNDHFWDDVLIRITKVHKYLRYSTKLCEQYRNKLKAKVLQYVTMEAKYMTDIELLEQKLNLIDNFDPETLKKICNKPDLCIVCYDRSRQVVLMPCRHYILCFPCALTIKEENKGCCVCKDEIVSLIKVYNI